MTDAYAALDEVPAFEPSRRTYSALAGCRRHGADLLQESAPGFGY